MSENIVLHMDNLSFRYPDKSKILEKITLSLFSKEKTAIIGPNGSGKTTLFLLLCGILKPESGKIEVNGNTIRHNHFNPEITYLFQTPDDQLFSPTVFDDIAFGPLNMGLSREEILIRVKAALETVNLTHLSDKPPHHLSGGEKRMAAIATILSMMPDILLFDEPTSNLDAKNRRQVISTIKEINKTMFISSHDLEFLLETCNRCILLDSGKIIADGPIVDILINEQLLNMHHMEKPHSLIPHIHSEHSQ